MKRKFKIIFKVSISIIVLITVLLILSNHNIKTSLNKYWYNDENKTINYSEILRCNYDLIRPEVAFVSDHILLEDFEELKVYFYKMENIFSKKENNRSFIGTTTIKNTTFPELVVMVKDDCEQFQKGKGDYWGEDIAWSHTPAPTQEELDERHIDSMRSDFIDLSEESREIFYRIYEVIHKDMIVGDEKTLEIYNKIEEDGGLHVDVQTQIQLEEDEYQRKVESGEIVEKTKVERMREANIDEEIIKLYVEQNGGVYVAPE